MFVEYRLDDLYIPPFEGLMYAPPFKNIEHIMKIFRFMKWKADFTTAFKEGNPEVIKSFYSSHVEVVDWSTVTGTFLVRFDLKIYDQDNNPTLHQLEISPLSEAIAFFSGEFFKSFSIIKETVSHLIAGPLVKTYLETCWKELEDILEKLRSDTSKYDLICEGLFPALKKYAKGTELFFDLEKKSELKNVAMIYYPESESLSPLNLDSTNEEVKNLEDEGNQGKLHKISSGSKYGFKYDRSLINSTEVDVVFNSIWKVLKEEKLIAPKVKFSVFRNVFTGSQISERVEWIGDINQLKYFIDLVLIQRGYNKANRKRWQITTHCFKLSDSKELATDQLRNTKIPLGYKKVNVLKAIEPFIRIK